MTGVKLHDHNCGFKFYRSEIFDEVRLYGEFHRFIPVLAAARGWKVGEVVVNHRPREHGKSKYGMSRIIKGFLDLLTVSFLTSYNHRPQHLLGSIGLLSTFVGSISLLYLAIYWILRYYESTQSCHLPSRERSSFTLLRAWSIASGCANGDVWTARGIICRQTTRPQSGIFHSAPDERRRNAAGRSSRGRKRQPFLIKLEPFRSFAFIRVAFDDGICFN